MSKTSLPTRVTEALSSLGGRIRTARRRRALTMEQMAQRMFVSRKTLSRLERGDTGSSLAVLASALWVLGLEQDLLQVASLDRDEVGKFRERQRLPSRVRGLDGPDEPEF